MRVVCDWGVSEWKERVKCEIGDESDVKEWSE